MRSRIEGVAFFCPGSPGRAPIRSSRHAPPVIELPTMDAPEDRLHRGSLTLRYEDVAEDGRVKLETLPSSLGVVWRGMLSGTAEAAALRSAGIVPILRRMVITGTPTPVAIHRPLDVEGRWETAHTAEGRTRFLMNMRVDLSGARGLTNGPPPERAGEVEPVGGVYAEHVFTRPFAQKHERRVEHLPNGVDPGPERAWIQQDSLLQTEAEKIDASFVDRGGVFFAKCHTDSNQHVNSLVYPRLFEERAVDAWGDGALLAREIEIAWHKPSFAGERPSVFVQRVRSGERRGALVSLSAPGEPHPRCVARLWLA